MPKSKTSQALHVADTPPVCFSACCGVRSKARVKVLALSAGSGCGVVPARDTGHSVDIGNLDLNLLRVFEALYQEQGVTRASRRLRMSQPATSAALKRLRQTFDDELFVRSGTRMIPTSRADQLQPSIEAALTHVRDVLRGSRKFDPDTCDEELRICTTEYGTAVVIPQLIETLQAKAPNVRLRVAPSRRTSVEEDLRIGECDLAVGLVGSDDAELQSEELFRESWVCIMRNDHPALERAQHGRMLREDFETYPQIRLAIFRSQGTILDGPLAAQGIELPAQYVVASFLSLGYLVQGSDVVAIGGERLFHAMDGAHAISALRPPVSLPSVPISLMWHSRTDALPLHGWVRELLLAQSYAMNGNG